MVYPAGAGEIVPSDDKLARRAMRVVTLVGPANRRRLSDYMSTDIKFHLTSIQMEQLDSVCISQE
jgi:hypothetical protein